MARAHANVDGLAKAAKRATWCPDAVKLSMVQQFASEIFPAWTVAMAHVRWVAQNMANALIIAVNVTLASQAKAVSSKPVQTNVFTTANACVGNASVKAGTRVQIALSALWCTGHAMLPRAHASVTRSARNLLRSQVKCGKAVHVKRRPVLPIAVVTGSVPTMGYATATHTSGGPRVKIVVASTIALCMDSAWAPRAAAKLATVEKTAARSSAR